MTMVAIDPEGAGGPEVLKLVTRPIPKPGAGEYLIQVVAAGEGTDPTCIGRRVCALVSSGPMPNIAQLLPANVCRCPLRFR